MYRLHDRPPPPDQKSKATLPTTCEVGVTTLANSGSEPTIGKRGETIAYYRAISALGVLVFVTVD